MNSMRILYAVCSGTFGLEVLITDTFFVIFVAELKEFWEVVLFGSRLTSWYGLSCELWYFFAAAVLDLIC